MTRAPNGDDQTDAPTDDPPHGHIDCEGLAMGVHDDLSGDEYHADPSLSSTLVRAADKSVDHYLHKLDDDSDSEAMRLGRLVHAAVLEPKRFEAEYIDAHPPERPGDDSWKPKHLETAALLVEHGGIGGGSDFEAVAEHHSKGYTASTYEKYAGKDGFDALVSHYADHDYDPDKDVDSDTLEEVLTIRDSVREHPKVRGGLLSGGHAERSHVWQWGDMPVRARCRPDYCQPFAGGVLLADLKTTSRSLGWWKRRGVWKRRGHQQAAWYTRGVEQTTGKAVTHFVYVVVQTKPPYDVQIVQQPDEALEAGHAANADAVDSIVNYWHDPTQYTGSSKRIETLDFPNWMQGD